MFTEQQALQQKKNYFQHNGAVFSDLSFGFIPAFKNLEDEQVHLSLDECGEISVMHLFDHLPDHWIYERDEGGRALSLQPSIIAGFMRNARFYTLGEIMGHILDS